MSICRVDGRVNPWKNSNLRPPLQNLQPQTILLRPQSVSGSDRLWNCNGSASSRSGRRARIAAQRLKNALADIEEKLAELGWTIHM